MLVFYILYITCFMIFDVMLGEVIIHDVCSRNNTFPEWWGVPVKRWYLFGVIIRIHPVGVFTYVRLKWIFKIGYALGSTNIAVAGKWTLKINGWKMKFPFQMGDFQVPAVIWRWFSYWKCLRLFQHTFGTHPEQPLPTGYKSGFLS